MSAGVDKNSSTPKTMFGKCYKVIFKSKGISYARDYLNKYKIKEKKISKKLEGRT